MDLSDALFHKKYAVTKMFKLQGSFLIVTNLGTKETNLTMMILTLLSCNAMINNMSGELTI